MINLQSLNPSELAALKRRLESNFLFFVRIVFEWYNGKTFYLNDHHIEIARVLEQVYSGKISKLIINIPPRYSKTEMLVLFTVWAYIKNPACKFIHTSYSEGLVVRNSSRIKAYLNHENIRALWAEAEPAGSGNVSWGTVNGGEFYAVPSGGQITGFGAGDLNDLDEEGNYVFSGALTIDDPLKPEDANSEAMRLAVNRKWDETYKSRLNSPRTPVIVIMQRLHEDDFTATLLADTEFKWHNLVLPAIVEKNGKERALWKRKHTLRQLRAMREKDIYSFSSQMQQEPTPKGGAIFKAEWLKFHDCKLPKDAQDVNCWIIGDTAMKTGQHNDYSVFGCFIACPDIDKSKVDPEHEAKSLYLVDMARGRWEAPELLKQARAFWNRCQKHTKHGVEAFYIEDKASGTGLIQTLKREDNIPIIAIQRNRDKVTRAYSAAPYIQSGRFYVNQNASWKGEFIDEILKFSPMMTHKHDDQCDVVFDAIEKMTAYTESGLGYFEDAEQRLLDEFIYEDF
jgi:predicted phage terminase large subunit-like protein